MAGEYGLDEGTPEFHAAAAETEEVATRVLAQAVVHGGCEARPEPGVVFGGEVGRVVWEVVGGGRSEEDFRRIVREYGEELGARVGWEVEGWGARVVKGRWWEGEGCCEDEGKIWYLGGC